MPKLTDAAVQRFKAAAGNRVDHFDAGLPGFGLRVAGPTPRNPPGRKSWVLFYRIAGKQRRATLGSYPEMSLAEARAAAILIKAGKEPPGKLAAAPAATLDTVSRVVEEFMRRYMEQGQGRRRPHSPRYIQETHRNFKNHVLPRWGDRPIKSITKRDVIALLNGIVDAGKPIAANRVLAAISALFTWAAGEDIIDASPTAGVKKRAAEAPRERVLSDAELAAIWNAASDYPFGPFVRLLLLTAQRRSEVASMRWQDIATEKRIWTIPGEMTKSGRTQLVPLSELALRVLAECPLVEGNPYVFSTRRDRPISGFSKMKPAIDAAAGVTGWRLHDARRTCATRLADLKVPRFVVERVLNHADNTVTGRHYDHAEYLDEKRGALDRWSAYVGQLVKR
jgi:integrase